MVSIENPKFVCKKSRSEVSNSFTGNENTAAASPATSIEWFEFSVLDPPPSLRPPVQLYQQHFNCTLSIKWPVQCIPAWLSWPQPIATARFESFSLTALSDRAWWSIRLEGGCVCVCKCLAGQPIISGEQSYGLILLRALDLLRRRRRERESEKV